MLLPDPWMPPVIIEAETYGTGVIGAGTIVLANNTSVYYPVSFPIDCTIYDLSFVATNTSGNFDIGFYDADLKLIQSKGTTAMSAACQTLAFSSDLRVRSGLLYYAGFGFSSSLAQCQRATGFGLYGNVAVGSAKEATFPLPTTATPTTPDATVIVAFAFGVR